MRNTFILIKNYFNCFLHNILSKKKEAFKYSSALLLLLLFGGLFVFMFASLSFTTTMEALSVDAPIISLYLTAAMSIMFVLLMTITKSTTPSKNTDDEMLLSLPVSKTNIVIAKVFYDYLFDFAIVLITLLPSYIVYLWLVPGASIFILVRGVLVIFTLPMLSSALGYFIGLFFSFLARHFKHYNIIQSIITVILLIGFLGAYYGIAFVSSNDSISGANVVMGLEPVQWIVNFTYYADLSSLLFILLCTVVPFVISVIIKSKLLGVTINTYKSKNKTLNFKSKSVTYALFKREASRYFSIPLYVMNTCFGGILLIVIGVIISTIGMDYINNLLVSAGIGSLSKYYFIIILLLIEFSISTICITSSSISLEGKTLWVLKVHPINPMEVFNAKIYFNTLFAFIPSLICSILVCVQLGFIYLPFFIIICLLSSYIISTVGLIINLIYPKLEWENEGSVVKKGLSVIISMGVNVLLLLVPILFYYLCQGLIIDELLLLIVCLIYLIISFVVYLILKKKGPRLLNNLNN